jgi:hypothetical protein
MATIHTILPTESRHTPFTGGTDARRLAQGAARAETRFTTAAAASWPNAGAGNNRSLAVTVELNRDYAWVLTDMSAIFIQSGGGDAMAMDAVAFTEITLPVPGGSEYYYVPLVSNPSRQDTTGATALGSIRSDHYNAQYPILDVGSPAAMTFTPVFIPKYMLYPFDNSNNEIDLTTVFSEAESNKAALTVRFSARFLQYDITQAYDWRVQSPTLTR